MGMEDENKYREMFAANLRVLMQEKELNLFKLHEDTGIGISTISNWLNLKRSPQIEFLHQLADYFHCSVDYLLGRED